MSGVSCDKEDYNFWMCDRDRIVNKACTHKRDVGIKCLEGLKLYNLIYYELFNIQLYYI